MRTYKWVLTPWTPLSINKYETYLENQAQNGWIFQTSRLSFLFTKFVRQEPSKLCFCIDFQRTPQTEYTTIMEDDGWILAQMTQGWYLWIKAYTTERPAIFTDHQSFIDRNQRLLLTLGVILLPQIPISLVIMRRLTAFPQVSWMIFSIGYFFVILCLISYFIALFIANRKMKKRI